MNSTINKYVNAVKSLPLRSHTDTVVPISFPVKRQHGLDRYSLLLNEFQDSTHFHGKARANSVNSEDELDCFYQKPRRRSFVVHFCYATRRRFESLCGSNERDFSRHHGGGKGFKKARYPC